jgi:hypothetical protein
VRLTVLAALLTFPLECITAGNFMPIEPGNSWIYRSQNNSDTFVVRVGTTGYLLGGQVYYKLTGYTPEELFVRAAESGDVYYYDEELGRELLLTSFEASNSFWYHAPKRVCEQEFQPQPRKVDYRGPAGSFNQSALRLDYRSFACADAGIEQEVYVENIGMVQRVSTTIAGPVTYDLVRAHAGSVLVAERPAGSFSVTVRKLSDRLVAGLHLDVSGGHPARLVFPTSQEYDVVLRDAAGQVIWRWSDGLVFAQAVHERTVTQLTYSVDIPLIQDGRGLPPGAYTVEGWLSTEPRQFSSAATIDIQPSVPQ